ncbi:MAG TPA: hypothetical protein EYP65_01445 [Armatimonadetes bacterium]|nr:hypothetical protein [Armatimonadota bacterium]
MCPRCGRTGRETCPFCGGTGRPGDIQRTVMEGLERAVEVRYVLFLPGEVYKTNADLKVGGRLEWRLMLSDLERGRVLYAESRAVNLLSLLGLAGTAFCLLMGLGLLLWRASQKGEEELPSLEGGPKYSPMGR